MAERTEFVFPIDPTDRPAIVQLSNALLDVVAPVALTATIDGYIDGWLERPAVVAEIERTLVERYGSERAGIQLDLTKADDLSILRVFGPWCIDADVFAEEPRPIISFHDARVDTARLTDGELAALRFAVARFDQPVEFVPAAEWDSQRRSARRERRRTFLRRMLGRS